MSLDELSVGERTCSNCGSYSCQGLLVAFAGKQAKDCASWNESSASVRVRAEKRIAELEALVPHPGDGSCDKCGAAPAVHVPMSLCRECYGTEKRIEDLEDLLRAALCQGAHVDIDGYIDTCHLSTWDEIAEYLEECGKLVRTEHGYRMVGE